MHSAVLQNKKYIKFAAKNTVEVMAVSGVRAAVQKGARKAAQYEGVDASGKKVQFMASWPGLTLEQIEALRGSPASRFNDTGAIPHTSFVDPFTLEKISGIRGGASSKQVMESAEAALKKIRKANGKPSFTRKDLAKIESAGSKVSKELGKKRLDKALSAVSKIEKAAKKWPQLAKQKIASIKERALEAARTKIDQLVELGKKSPKVAKAKLSVLASRLKGTELYERVQQLVAKFSPAGDK